MVTSAKSTTILFLLGWLPALALALAAARPCDAQSRDAGSDGSPKQPAAAAQPSGAASLPALQRIRTCGAPWLLAERGRATAEIVLDGEAAESELVVNAAQWIADWVQRNAKARPQIRTSRTPVSGGRCLIALVGVDALRDRRRPPQFERLRDELGPQGFVLYREKTANHGESLVCWSPTALGCRYGLIEILRSLRSGAGAASTDLVHVVDRPEFPVRICYVNFGEHLQNAYNPNLLFDVPVNRWKRADWDRFIDMVSGFRYNVFEFWLVPTLFSPDALQGGKIHREFAETINQVIVYARRRGVEVHPILAVNTVGGNWHPHCPKVPGERAEILSLWDHWSRAIRGNSRIGIFPGDPGGCFRNGCTAETYVDLCLELSKIVRRNNPAVQIELGTWGEPMGGWGVPLWTGDRKRADRAMRYLLAKLPQFPDGTFTSINLGFSPDGDPATHGGDGRPYAKEAAGRVPVLTWDYSVTEGEGTVAPHCRVRRMFQRRLEELAVGCYRGGICYTMAPKLQCLSIYSAAESWWNPRRSPDAVLADYGRLALGDAAASLGPLLEEFEVVPDWGYYPPFPFSPQRLRDAMGRLVSLLAKADTQPDGRLPLAPTTSEYRESLLFFAELFRDLADVQLALDAMDAVAKASGQTAPGRREPMSLDEVDDLLAAAPSAPGRAPLRAAADRVRRLDARGITTRYWKTVYGIYDVIPHPTDPRAGGAAATLFARFGCPRAIAAPRPAIEKPLVATGKPFVLLPLGRAGGMPGWKMSGFSLRGEDAHEAWAASFDEPGIVARNDFQNRGYRWLVVRLTEGPRGGGKTIAVNGTVVGRFVRTGPPVSQKKEWWVTRSYPIAEGLLKNGPIEIRFTEPGVAVSAVAFAAQRLPDTE